MPRLAPNSLMKRYDDKYVHFFAPICNFSFKKNEFFFLDFLKFQTDSNDSIESYEAYKAKRKDSRSDSLGKEKARLRFKLIVCKSKKKATCDVLIMLRKIMCSIFKRNVSKNFF